MYIDEITNINLIILRLKHKLLNYCACHTCSVSYTSPSKNDVLHCCGRVHIRNFLKASIYILQQDNFTKLIGILQEILPFIFRSK